MDPKELKPVPNSHKFKEEQAEKKIEKVAQGKLRKKSLGRKFSETFIKSDAEDVRSYVIFDVLVPAVVDTFRDIVNSGLDMFLYGDARRSAKGGSRQARSNRSYVSYRDYYDRRDPRGEERVETSRRRSVYKDLGGDICFDSRREAEEIVDAMINLIDTYEMVSVREFYELVNLEFDFTDEKYGWTNLRDISVSRVRDGYVINLPRPILLD